MLKGLHGFIFKGLSQNVSFKIHLSSTLLCGLALLDDCQKHRMDIVSCFAGHTIQVPSVMLLLWRHINLCGHQRTTAHSMMTLGQDAGPGYAV